MTGAEILDLKMPENDAKAKNVREYLKALLTQLWDRGEGFSGKRPFGNSGWEHDLYQALKMGGLGEEHHGSGIFKAIEAL